MCDILLSTSATSTQSTTYFATPDAHATINATIATQPLAVAHEMFITFPMHLSLAALNHPLQWRPNGFVANDGNALEV
jgi:hypothetical protein